MVTSGLRVKIRFLAHAIISIPRGQIEVDLCEHEVSMLYSELWASQSCIATPCLEAK